MSTILRRSLLLIVGLLVCAGLWWCGLGNGGSPADAKAGVATVGLATAGPATAGPATEATTTPSDSAGDTENIAVRAPATLLPGVDVGTGAVRVSVTYDNGSVASDVGVGLLPWGKPRSAFQWLRTNLKGEVEFKDIEAGRVTLRVDRAPIGNRSVAQVKPGETNHVNLVIASYLHISGTVVTAAGSPVPDAEILLYDERHVDETASPLTKTDSAGRFTVVTAFRSCWIGARARGWGASALQRILKIPGTQGDHELILRLQPGGEVIGLLTGVDGLPVANATIRVGNADVDSVISHGDTAAPLAATTRSGMDGTFLIIGVPAGEQPVQVRADGYAPWNGSCVVREAAATRLDIALLTASRIVGVVKTSSGAPCADVVVSAGLRGSLSWVSVVTTQDGRFALSPLAPGMVEVTATGSLGSVRAEIEVGVGQERDVVLVLGQAAQVSGRVTMEDGSNLVGARVEVRTNGQTSGVMTDANGQFVLSNLAPGEGIVTVGHRDAEDLRQDIAIPSNLSLSVRRKPPGTAAVRGRVTRFDGTAVTGADVGILCMASPLNSESAISDLSGSFECKSLQAGVYRICVTKGGLPMVTVADRRVDSGTTWMVGDIVMGQGGTIRVNAPTLDGAEVQVTVYYPGYRHAAYASIRFGSVVTAPLVPGECEVFLSGRTIGSEYHKVEVVAGQETLVTARCEPGYDQCILVDWVNGKTPNENSTPEEKWVISHVRRNGAIVTLKSGAWRNGQCKLSYCLAPGAYEVELTCGGRSLTLPITVAGTADAAPLRVTW